MFQVDYKVFIKEDDPLVLTYFFPLPDNCWVEDDFTFADFMAVHDHQSGEADKHFLDWIAETFDGKLAEFMKFGGEHMHHIYKTILEDKNFRSSIPHINVKNKENKGKI